MTVAELIAALEAVEDKSLQVLRGDYQFDAVEVSEVGVKTTAVFRGSLGSRGETLGLVID